MSVPELYPYQKKWVNDPSRFKIGMWARQSGKDFTCAVEAVLDCMDNPGTTWIVLGCGERQARETLEKAREWVRVYAESGREEKYPEGMKRSKTVLKATEIRWGNGSRFLALPAKPQTIRGFSANLILSEFAFHQDAGAFWRAIYPSISNKSKGGEKKVRIISTPNGRGNKFYELWNSADFARHKVTIEEASEQGLEVNIEELKKGMNDPEAWAQEYECQFIDSVAVLLPLDLIESCEDEAARRGMPLETYAGRDLYAGIDVGRHRDRTVCWILERVGSVLWTRDVIGLHDVPIHDQVKNLESRVGHCRKVCLDVTGMGVGLADPLVEKFREWDPMKHLWGKIELCRFTALLKCEIFPRLRAAMERGEVKIPSEKALREDLHAMTRVVGNSGQVTYQAPRTSEGHSDYCTALALAVRAAAIEPTVCGATTVKRSEGSFAGGGRRSGHVK